MRSNTTHDVAVRHDVGRHGDYWIRQGGSFGLLSLFLLLLMAMMPNEGRAQTYFYEPDFEVYDLTTVTNNGNSTVTAENYDAGYKLNNYDAYYIDNPYGYPLNKRFAIQKNLSGRWSWSSGLKQSQGWLFLSICNLKAGDRVKITSTGWCHFASSYNSQNNTWTYNSLNSDVFYR